MNRTLRYPPEMAGFKPYATPSAHIQSGDGTMFRAALGSLGDDKATFHVWVWTEAKDGTLAMVSIAPPFPNNAPTFAIIDGALVLHAVLEATPGVRVLVERDVPGYVEPSARDTTARKLVHEARLDIKAIVEAGERFGDDMPEIDY